MIIITYFVSLFVYLEKLLKTFELHDHVCAKNKTWSYKHYAKGAT